MKFYNPFKWHIVEFNDGKFGVRRFTKSLNTSYIDNAGREWLYENSRHIDSLCKFENVKNASKVLDIAKGSDVSCVKRVVQ